MNIRGLVSKITAVVGIMHGRKVFGGPVQADLRLTNRCNIRCIHCYYNAPGLQLPAVASLRRAKRAGQELPAESDIREEMQREADPHRMITVINELLSLGTRRFQIGGNGEPFFYKNIMEIAERIKRSGSYCLANTNGTLLDQDTADSLINMKFDELRITTMAGSPEVYCRTHPGMTEKMFYNLEQNILYLSERKKTLRVKRPVLILVLIVIAQNHDRLHEFAEFAVRVGAQGVLFRPVDDIGEPGLASTLLTEQQAIDVQEQMRELGSFLNFNGITHNIDYFNRIFREQLNTETLYNTIPCYYGWLAAFIDPGGEIYPCCRCYGPMGNIYEAGFQEIWNSQGYERFREEALQINKRGKPVTGCDCYSCVHHTANLRVYKMLHPMKRIPGN